MTKTTAVAVQPTTPMAASQGVSSATLINAMDRAAYRSRCTERTADRAIHNRITLLVTQTCRKCGRRDNSARGGEEAYFTAVLMSNEGAPTERSKVGVRKLGNRAGGRRVEVWACGKEASTRAAEIAGMRRNKPNMLCTCHEGYRTHESRLQP